MFIGKKTKQGLISISPDLYFSSSNHCDDIKTMINLFPSTLEYVFWNTLNSLYDALTDITKVSDLGGVNFIFDVAPGKEVQNICNDFVGCYATTTMH